MIVVNWFYSRINQLHNTEPEELDVKRVVLLQASMEKQEENKWVKNICKAVSVVDCEIKIGKDLLRE